MPESGSPCAFVALGDSLTEGRGDADGAGRLTGWAGRLLGRLRPPADAYLVNLARRNAEVEEVHDRQLPAAGQHHPALLSVLVGVNDVCGGFQPRRFRSAFGALLDAACAGCDTVLTATLPDLTCGNAVDERAAAALRTRLERANEAIAAVVGATTAACLDLWSLSRDWGARGWSADGLHPGPVGHRRIASGFRELLAAQHHPWASGEDSSCSSTMNPGYDPGAEEGPILLIRPSA
jgi:lysophospholipase L1-like esterase